MHQFRKNPSSALLAFEQQNGLSREIARETLEQLRGIQDSLHTIEYSDCQNASCAFSRSIGNDPGSRRADRFRKKSHDRGQFASRSKCGQKTTPTRASISSISFKKATLDSCGRSTNSNIGVAISSAPMPHGGSAKASPGLLPNNPIPSGSLFTYMKGCKNSKKFRDS